MRKKILKIMGIMLVMLTGCFCGLSGCKDKYRNMKLELSEKEIVLSLDKDDEENFVNRTAEFTAKVSGIDFDEISADVFYDISTPDVISLTRTNANENGVSKFVVTANHISTEPVIVTIRTKEGDKTASLTVTVKKGLQSIQASTTYSPFVVVGEDGTDLSATNAVIFTPEDTSEKQVKFSISRANGHDATISENGHLVVTRKNGVQPVMVKIESKTTNVDPIEIPVKVVEPIQAEDIKVMLEDNVIENTYKWSVMDLDNSDLELSLNLENTLEECVISEETKIIAYPTNQNILSLDCDKNKVIANGTKLTLHTQGTTGKNTLHLVVKLKDYDYKVEKDIEIEVAKLPNQILINNENLTNRSKAYDIYDKYQNNLGKKFTIEIGDESATIKKFKLFVAEDQRSQLNITLANGQPAMLDNSVEYPNGTVLYVKADDEYVPGNNPTLLISSAGSDEVFLQSILTFNLRTAATSVFVQTYGENTDTLYIEKGSEITLLYGEKKENNEERENKVYFKDLSVEGYDHSIIRVDIIDNDSQKPTIKITGLKVNSDINYAVTNLKIKLSNGFESEDINVYVFVASNSDGIKLKAPTILDSQYGKYIANVEYDNNGDLSNIVLAKGGIVKLDPQVKNYGVNATIFGQKFELVDDGDKSFISINNDGYINARQVKEDDEGKIRVRTTIQVLMSKTNNGVSNGDVELIEKVIEFDVSIFVQITSISLDKQYENIYFSNNLWYENNVRVKLNQTNLNLSIYPKNANPDDISWEVSDNSLVSVEKSPDNKTLYIEARDGNIQRTISITVFVTQKNKTYSKTCYLSLNPVIRPSSIQIDAAEYQGFLDNEINKRVLLNENIYQINGISQTVKEIYIDSRDLADNSFIDIFAHVTNNSATNKNVYYELYSDNYDICSLTSEGRLTFNTRVDALIAGTAIIRVFAQGSKTDKATDPTVSEYIAVKVSNGESIDNAFLIYSEKEFWKMLRDENIEDHYYILANNIYLTKTLADANTQSELKYNGKAPQYFASSMEHKYAIKNLVVDKLQTIINNDEIIMNGLSLFSEQNGIIKDIDFYISVNDSEVQYQTNNIIIAPIALINNGTIQKISVNLENVNVSEIGLQTDIENFVFGGMVGYNYGNIISNNQNFVNNEQYFVNFSGEIDLTEIEREGLLEDAFTAVGSIAGVNAGQIEGMIVQNLIINSLISNVGGLIGINYGQVKDNLVNGDVYGYQNVGGLVGQNQNANIYNNIVEIYETNRINEILAQTENHNAIYGYQNIGGLVGLIDDSQEYQASTLMYNYIRCYSDRILITGQENVGGLIGFVDGIKVELDTDLFNQTTIDTNFAYAFINGDTNIGGLVGQIINAKVDNVYARGNIGSENISSLFGLDTDVDLTDAYYVESEKRSDLSFSPWTTSIRYNDGYSILMVNLEDYYYIMEKVIPNEIIVTENQKVIKKVDEEYQISDWFENVNLSDLILKSSDNQVFTIGQSNNIIFRGYGKAVLYAYSKYNRNIHSEIEVVFIHNVDDLKLNSANDVYENNYLQDNNPLQILKNSSTTLYPFAMSSGQALTGKDIENLYISFEYNGRDYFYVNGEPIISQINQVEVWDEDSEQFVQVRETVYKKFAIGEMIITALEKNDIFVKVHIYEKVGDEYFALLDNTRMFEMVIKEGIQSISINKSEVDLTTMNDVDFTVTIVADIDTLSFEYNDTDSHIDGIDGEDESKELILVDNYEQPADNGDGTFTYTRTFTLRVKDEFFRLENSTDNLLREAFNTLLNINVKNGNEQLGTCALRVNVKPQELLKIDTLHFPNGLQTKEQSGEDVYEPNELPANTITPGEFGLLMIDIYPSYAYFDKIEVIYETESSYQMSLIQVAKATVNELNESKNKFLEIRPSALIENNKIILSRTSEFIMDEHTVTERSFTGRYYVKTLVPTKTPAGTSYRIIVKATTYGKNGEAETVLFSKEIIISTLPRPSVDVDADVQDYQIIGNEYYIARGTSQNISAITQNYSKNAEFFVNAYYEYYEDNELKSMSLSDKLEALKEEFIAENTAQYGDIVEEVADLLYKDVSLTGIGNSQQLYVPIMIPSGTKIVITSRVSKFINGIEVYSTSEIVFRVADYVISGLETNYENNVINIVLGQQKTVSLKLQTDNTDKVNSQITDAQKYIDTYDALNKAYKKINVDDDYPNGKDNPEYLREISKGKLVRDTLLAEIKKINDSINEKNTDISTVTNESSNWYYKTQMIDANGIVEKTDYTEDAYYVTIGSEAVDGQFGRLTLLAKITKNSAIESIKAEVSYNYVLNENGIDIEFVKDNYQQTFAVNNLKIYITTSATIDNPMPVFTVSKMLSLGEEDYILMNDLYLTKQDDVFTNEYREVKDTQVESNVIPDDLLKSHDYYYFDENARFTSITPTFKSFDGNGYTIYINSFAFDLNSNIYGLFNYIPSGCIVKNLNVVFITDRDTYTITGENISSATFGLFAGKNDGIITNCSVSFASENSDISNITIEIDKDVDSLVGTFVGENKGYITNSNVGGINLESTNIINIKASGQLAGFVGKNDGKISTSYAFNTGVYNTASTIDVMTAGFVAENTSSGQILECFAEGFANVEHNGEPTEENYDANKMNNIIISNGNIGGFVHQNNGYISDCYSNVPLQTPSRSSGFVFMNSGDGALIEKCYSITKSVNQNQTTSFTYFTGTDTISKVNNLNNARILTSYYYADAGYIDEEKDDEFKEPAQKTSDLTNEFYGFETSSGAKVWKFSDLRPTLFQTTQETSSRRTIQTIRSVDNSVVSYNYSYDTKNGSELGSENNPVVVYNAESFLQAFNGGELKVMPNGEEYRYNKGSIRLIADIDLADYAGSEALSLLQDVVFAGVLDGNGFELNNVRILGNEDEKYESFGLFRQIGYNGSVEDNMTAKSGVVKNLKINILEVTKTKSKCVGVLAGIVTEASTVYNIDINGDNITIEGRNAVGGLVGYVDKQSVISRITSNVGVTAAYAKNKKLSDYAISDDNVKKYNAEQEFENKNFDEISYAGGIIGILDNNDYDETSTKLISNCRSLKVYGTVNIQAEITGGIVGYNGEKSEIFDCKFELVKTGGQSIEGKFASGGLVGENYGTIRGSRVEVNDLEVDGIDKDFNNATSNALFESSKTNPRYVGGLVGFMPYGQILDSFSKANVIHSNTRFIGGIAGQIGGGEKTATILTLYANGDGGYLISSLMQVYGTNVRNVYTTGNVFTDPNYDYKFKIDTNTDEKIEDISDLNNGTKPYNVIATPQNYIGGLFGQTLFNMYGSNDSENLNLATDVLKSIVAANNWRTDFISINNSDINYVLRTFNGTDNDEATKNIPSDEVRHDELGNDDDNIIYDEDHNKTYITYAPSVGYFAGNIEILENGQKRANDAQLEHEKHLIKEKGSLLYLNNFIGKDNKYKLIKQNASGTEIGFDCPQNNGVPYETLSTNVRYSYRNETEDKELMCYTTFTSDMWSKQDYIYPKLTFSNSADVIRIYTEEDLRKIANTSSSVRNYILENDIYLTRNWIPVEGFKGILQTENGETYTIYNININTEGQEERNNVGFFASSEDGIIRNVEFVYGTHLIPDIVQDQFDENIIVYNRSQIDFEEKDGKLTGKFKFTPGSNHGKGNILTKWDIINGYFPYSDENEIVLSDNGRYQILDSDSVGGIRVVGSNDSADMNISALFGTAKNIDISSISLKFAHGSRVEFNIPGNSTGVNVGLIAADYENNDGMINFKSLSIDCYADHNYTNVTPIESIEPDVLIKFKFDTNTSRVDDVNYGGAFGRTKGSEKIVLNSFAFNANVCVQQNYNGYFQSSDIKSSVALGGLIGSAGSVDLKDIYIKNGGSIFFEASNYLEYYVGGLIGKTTAGEIDVARIVKPIKFTIGCDSYVTNSTKDTSNFYYGGLIGYATGVKYKTHQKDSIGDSINTSLSFIDSVMEANAVYIGGLFGYSNGNSVSCKPMLEVTFNAYSLYFNKVDNAYIGGVIGKCVNTKIQDVLSNGKINIGSIYHVNRNTGQTYLGGFIGSLDDKKENTETEAKYQSKITSCVSQTNIDLNADNSTYSYVGGFVGYAYGNKENDAMTEMTKCYSFGYLSIGEYLGIGEFHGWLGGFIGRKANAFLMGIKNGNMSDEDEEYGLYSFATIFTKATDSVGVVGGASVGGFAGYLYGNEDYNCYYAYAYAGVPHNGLGKIITINSAGTFSGTGIDIPYNIVEKINAPYRSNPEGRGSKLYPMKLSSYSVGFELNVNTAYYLDQTDLFKHNLKTAEYTVVINNYNDSNYVTNDDERMFDPIFDTIAKNSLVSGICAKIDYAVDVSLNNHTFVGAGFVKYNNGTVFNCAVKGTADIGKRQISSFAGFAYNNSGVIINCSSSLEIDVGNQEERVAGFVLDNGSLVQNCIASGQFKNTKNATILGFGGGDEKFVQNYSNMICLGEYKKAYGFNDFYNEYNPQYSSHNSYDAFAFYIPNDSFENDELKQLDKEQRRQTSFFFRTDSKNQYSQFIKDSNNKNVWVDGIDACEQSYNYGYPLIVDYNLIDYNSSNQKPANPNFYNNTGNGEKVNEDNPYDKPYEIPHVGKFDWIRSVTKYKVYFKQTNDLDFNIFDSLGAYLNTVAPEINSNGFIARTSSAILTYDGDNHMIDNIIFTNNNFYALFDKVYAIKNLYLDNVEYDLFINESGTTVGALAGEVSQAIINCGVYYLSVNIEVSENLSSTARTYFGGLTGSCRPTYYKDFSSYDYGIHDSFVSIANAYIDTYYVGGFVGAYYGSISGSFANIEISTKKAKNIGGLAGLLWHDDNEVSAVVTNSFAMGRISYDSNICNDTTNTCIGGLAGIGGLFRSNTYSLVSIVENITKDRDSSTIKIRAISENPPSNEARYDKNISLCDNGESNVDSSKQFNFADKWFNSENYIANEYKLTSDDTWVYNNSKYPFQRQYKYNAFAIKCAGYEQVGSYIYPYKIYSSTDINVITEATTKSVLLKDITIIVNDEINLSSGKYIFINGNGKTLSGTGANILKNSKNVILSNVTIKSLALAPDEMGVVYSEEEIKVSEDSYYDTIEFVTSGNLAMLYSEKLEADTHYSSYNCYSIDLDKELPDDSDSFLGTKYDKGDIYEYEYWCIEKKSLVITYRPGYPLLTISGNIRVKRIDSKAGLGLYRYTWKYDWEYMQNIISISVTNIKDGYIFKNWTYDAEYQIMSANFYRFEDRTSGKMENDYLYNVSFYYNAENSYRQDELRYVNYDMSAVLSKEIVNSKLKNVNFFINSDISYQDRGFQTTSFFNKVSVYGGIISQRVTDSVFENVSLDIKGSYSYGLYVVGIVLESNGASKGASLFTDYVKDSFYDGCSIQFTDERLRLDPYFEIFGTFVGYAVDSTFTHSSSNAFKLTISSNSLSGKIIGGYAGYMFGCKLSYTGMNISLSVTEENNKSLYVGGLVGIIQSEDDHISKVRAITLYNNVYARTGNNNIYVGGVFGSMDATTFNNCLNISRESGTIEGISNYKYNLVNYNKTVNSLFNGTFGTYTQINDSGDIYYPMEYYVSKESNDTYKYNGDSIIELVHFTYVGGDEGPYEMTDEGIQYALKNNVKPEKEGNFFYKYWYINGTIRLSDIANVGGFAGCVNGSVSSNRNGNSWYKDSERYQMIYEMSNSVNVKSNVEFSTKKMTVELDSSSGASAYEYLFHDAAKRWLDEKPVFEDYRTYSNVCAYEFISCNGSDYANHEYTLSH